MSNLKFKLLLVTCLFSYHLMAQHSTDVTSAKRKNPTHKVRAIKSHAVEVSPTTSTEVKIVRYPLIPNCTDVTWQVAIAPISEKYKALLPECEEPGLKKDTKVIASATKLQKQ
jgi:hypothetical protein